MSNVLDSIDEVEVVSEGFGTSVTTEELVITDGTDRMHVALYDGSPRLKCGAPTEFRKMREKDYKRYFQSRLPRCGNCITSS